MDQRVLRWFGHVERMDEYHMTRWVLMADVSGWRVRGREVRLMDCVKVALCSRRWRPRQCESITSRELWGMCI